MRSSYLDAVMGSLPFVPIWIVGVILLYLFPELALWLPTKLY